MSARRAPSLHLLRVEQEAHVFGPLLVAAAAAGARVGWLELRAPPPPPESLRAVLAAGGTHAVAVGEGWSVAVRGRKGPARLGDVLRRQFPGCALVLVHGDVDAPLLQPVEEGGWRVTGPAGATHRFAIDELLAALRKPRPWPA
jgi:hypothetical protein